MDKLSRFAVAGSLTWLVLAIGLAVGTHGSTVAEPRTLEAGSNQPAGRESLRSFWLGSSPVSQNHAESAGRGKWANHWGGRSPLHAPPRAEAAFGVSAGSVPRVSSV